MKNTIAIVILAVVCIGLIIGLAVMKSQNDADRRTDAETIVQFSNNLVNASRNLDDLGQHNQELTNSLVANQKQLLDLSNNLEKALGALSASKASLQSAQEQVANLNGRIADLEAQNKALDDRATDLTNQIIALNAQIADTEFRLAHSQTNNAFLQRELQRQIAARTELERKFSDLNEMRAQVKKLREAAFVARRLQWMRAGITDQKGAELLVRPRSASAAPGFSQPPHYDLNVEVNSDGSVRVIPPITNAETGGNKVPSR